MSPEIAPEELTLLGAALLGVTRSPVEWRQVSGRRDQFTTWGLGLHPGLPKVQASFCETTFRADLVHAAVVGEVGLDARSSVPIERQVEVFESIAEAVSHTPRLVTIHSNGACGRLLDIIAQKPFRTPVLHWWQGKKAETAAAIQLGCFFSVNGAQPISLLEQLPQNRVITETDFPFTLRRDPQASRPGATAKVEKLLAQVWGVSQATTRQVIWRNLSTALPPESLRLLAPGWRATLRSVAGAQ